MNDSPVGPVGDPEPGQVVSQTGSTAVGTVVPAKGDTSYVLLASYADGLWTLVETISARDAESAIKTHVEKLGEQEQKEGSFVAVNAKFWRPVKPAVEVVTTKTITLKAAS